MVIDLSFLTTVISDLNYFFTNLARSEQMKDIDMRKQRSQDLKTSDQDISSTNVELSFEDEQIKMHINTNDNNTSSVWKNNFLKMANTLLYSKIKELIAFYMDQIKDQFIPFIASIVEGGVLG